MVGALGKSAIFIGAMEQEGKLYIMKERTLGLSQDKGRSIILNEGFPWKEGAEEDGICAWKTGPKGQIKKELLSQGGKNNHSERNDVVCTIAASTKYRK